MSSSNSEQQQQEQEEEPAVIPLAAASSSANEATQVAAELERKEVKESSSSDDEGPRSQQAKATEETDVASTSSTQNTTGSGSHSRGAGEGQDKPASTGVAVSAADDALKAKELACAEVYALDRGSSPPAAASAGTSTISSRQDKEDAKAKANSLDSKRPAVGICCDNVMDEDQEKKPKAREVHGSSSSSTVGSRRRQRDSNAKQQQVDDRLNSTSSQLPGAYAASPGKRAQRVRTMRYSHSYDSASGFRDGRGAPRLGQKKPPPSQQQKAPTTISEEEEEVVPPPPPGGLGLRAVTTSAAVDRSTFPSEAAAREFMELRKRAIGLATSSTSTSLSEQLELISKLQLEDDPIIKEEENENDAPKEERIEEGNEHDARSTTAADELLRASTSSRMSSLTDIAASSSSDDNEEEDEEPAAGDEENQLSSVRSSQLPVAAEVYLSSLEDVEGDLRELVRQEILDSCSVAFSVSSSSHLSDFGLADNDKKPWRTKKCFFGTFAVFLIGVVITFVVLTVLSRGGGNNNNNNNNQGSNSDSSDNMTMPNSSPTTTLPSLRPMEEDDNTIIATIPDTICYERAPLMGSSRLCPPQPLGSAVTNFVAESRLWSVPQANISILNAGEVQADMAMGDFSIAMAKEVLPFSDNTLVTLQLEGFQIATVLERSIQKVFEDALLQQSINRTFTASSYPYAAGIRFDVNMTKPFPYRISNLQGLGGEHTWSDLVLQGVPYTVVTNSYLAHGGDGYHEFSDMDSTATPQFNTGLNSLQEFVAYCQHKEILLNPPLKYFSTQHYTPDPNLLY